jgi:hypothetical protein
MIEKDETPEPEPLPEHPASGRADPSLRTVGWAGIAVWAAVGLALEAAHGLKLAAYLDDELTRLLLTLAHAHGVALSIVLVLVAHHAAPLLPERDTLTRHLAIFAWVALPLGFALASIAHPESDPGLAIWIVPPAALALVLALGRVALASARAR